MIDHYVTSNRVLASASSKSIGLADIALSRIRAAMESVKLVYGVTYADSSYFEQDYIEKEFIED
jgi:hypothetical protein